jgi:large repetitive protein
MKMFWQAGRNALARALSAIVSPAVSSASPAPRNGRCTAISRIALAAAAILLLSLGAAHATGTVPTQITLTSSPNPSSAGASVTFTATVTGGNGITGTVDILNEDNSGQVIGSGSVGANGVATINITFNTATVFVLAAGYSGDNTFAPSQSNLISQTVENGIVTTMNASSSPNPSVLGQLVTFTVNITAANGGTPTGVVTFTDQSSNATIPNATLSPAPGGGAMGSTTISSLSVETHSISVTYAGDGTFAGAQASITQTVVNGTPTTTTLTSSQNPSSVGQTVMFTATVTGSGGPPTGTVTFFDETQNASLATVNLSGGTATFSTNALVAETHAIQATYNPAANSGFATSNATINQTVVNGTPTTTTLTSSQNPSTVNQSVTFTATVTGNCGTPTGTVTFQDSGGLTLGTQTLNNSGVASVTTSMLSVGTHQISATCNPAANSTFAASVTSINQAVDAAVVTNRTLTSSPNPSAVGQAVTFTATVTLRAGQRLQPAPSLSRTAVRRSVQSRCRRPPPPARKPHSPILH